MNSHLDSSGKHSDGRTDGRNHWHCQGWAYCVNRFLDSLRHFWQGVVIKHFVLHVGFVRCVLLCLIACSSALFHSFLTDSRKHILQSLRHLRDFLVQCRVDASHLFLFGKPIVAGNNLSQKIAVKTTDMAQIHSQLEGQRIAVGAHRLLPVIIHLPPLLNDFPIRNPKIIVLRDGGSRS